MLIPSFERFQRALDEVERVPDKDLPVCNSALCDCATKIRLHIRENEGFPTIVLAPLLAHVVEELIQRSSAKWSCSVFPVVKEKSKNKRSDYYICHIINAVIKLIIEIKLDTPISLVSGTSKKHLAQLLLEV